MIVLTPVFCSIATHTPSIGWLCRTAARQLHDAIARVSRRSRKSQGSAEGVHSCCFTWGKVLPWRAIAASCKCVPCRSVAPLAAHCSVPCSGGSDRGWSWRMRRETGWERELNRPGIARNSARLRPGCWAVAAHSCHMSWHPCTRLASGAPRPAISSPSVTARPVVPSFAGSLGRSATSCNVLHERPAQQGAQRGASEPGTAMGMTPGTALPEVARKHSRDCWPSRAVHLSR